MCYNEEEIHVFDTAFHNKDDLKKINKHAKGLDKAYAIMRSTQYSDIAVSYEDTKVSVDFSLNYCTFEIKNFSIDLSYDYLYTWYRDNEMNLSDKDSLVYLRFLENVLEVGKSLLNEIVKSGVADEFTIRKAIFFLESCTKHSSLVLLLRLNYS